MGVSAHRIILLKMVVMANLIDNDMIWTALLGVPENTQCTQARDYIGTGQWHRHEAATH